MAKLFMRKIQKGKLVKKRCPKAVRKRPSNKEVPRHGKGHITRKVKMASGPNKGRAMVMRFYRTVDGKIHSSPVNRCMHRDNMNRRKRRRR